MPVEMVTIQEQAADAPTGHPPRNRPHTTNREAFPYAEPPSRWRAGRLLRPDDAGHVLIPERSQDRETSPEGSEVESLVFGSGGRGERRDHGE